MMRQDSRILVTGSGGVLGSALIQELSEGGYVNVMSPSRAELDCSDKASVEPWFFEHRPEYVFHLASLVFGLKGNLDNQLRSLQENVRIADTILDAASRFSVRKVFYAGTVAAYAYPYGKLPLEEGAFWNGEPHGGEYGYAVAKRYALSLLKVLRDSRGLDFSYGIFTNLYGPRDRFDTVNGHVIPSLVRKAFDARRERKPLRVWGRPDTVRDFLYSHDAARAALHCMNVDLELVNISSGEGKSMAEVVAAIKAQFSNSLAVTWDSEAPIGIPHRVVDNSLLTSSGFKPSYSLEEGVSRTVDWYRVNEQVVRT